MNSMNHSLTHTSPLPCCVPSQVQGAPDFVSKEIARLTKMKDDGSVAPAKKAQFSKRLNALSSFA